MRLLHPPPRRRAGVGGMVAGALHETLGGERAAPAAEGADRRADRVLRKRAARPSVRACAILGRFLACDDMRADRRQNWARLQQDDLLWQHEGPSSRRPTLPGDEVEDEIRDVCKRRQICL